MILRKVLLLLLLFVTNTQSLDEKRIPNVFGIPNNGQAIITVPDIQPLQTFTTINSDKYIGPSINDDTDTSPSLLLCQKYCSCDANATLIDCQSIQKLHSLISKGVGYEDEFAKFRVKVSDPEISDIGRRFVLEKNSSNGLLKVKYLVLDKFPFLTTIDPTYFERTFPNLKGLTVTEGENKLREITIGYLPHLQQLKVTGDLLKIVRGCNDEETYCFDPDFMESLELPTLTLTNLGLPDDIGDVTVIPNGKDTAEIGDSHVFDGKVVERLKFKIIAGNNFPTLFDKVTVNEQFDFEIPSLDDEQMELLLSDARKNPSLYSRMKVRVNKGKFVFPVYYKSCIECDYDEVYTTLHKTGTCTEEKNYLEKYNPDLNDLKIQDITIRGIYIDIDELIKQIKEFNPKPKYRLTVYTFVARKPKFKTIDLNIRIFYGMLDGHSSLHQHMYAANNSSMTFIVQDMFGTSLKYAKRLDSLFVQSYSTCIAKLATDFKRNNPTKPLHESTPWQMFINLPNTGIYSSDKDKLTNARASAIQSLLTRYMYILAEDKTTLNKIPYTSMEIQREVATTLLKSAESILGKKIKFSMDRKLDDLNDTSALALKQILDQKDDSEMRLLEGEKERTKSLVTIIVKQKELYEGELDAIKAALEDVKRSYEYLQAEFRDRSERFEDAASFRHADSWADVASEVTSSVISVVNLGKFDMSDITKPVTMSTKIMKRINALKRLLSDILKTQKKMKKIAKIFRKIGKVYKVKHDTLRMDLRKITSNDIDPSEINKFVEILTKFSDDVQNAEDVAEGLLAVYKAKTASNKLDLSSEVWEDTLYTEEINIINPGEDITTKDILQWDDVREKIEKLFNHHVMVQIPETGRYKATMFNMITKGKAMSQLKLDETKLMADIGFANKAYWQYIEEYAALGVKIQEVAAVKKARKIDYDDEKAEKEYDNYYDATDKDLYSQEFITKMTIIEASHLFCQGFYYDHLQKCPEKYNIDIYTSLRDAIQRYRGLILEQNVDKLYSFQPTPQPFNNIAVFIRKEANCDCVLNPYLVLNQISGRKTSKIEQSIFTDNSIRNCFRNKRWPYSDQDKLAIFDKLDNCNMNRLNRFSNESTIAFDIPVKFLPSFDRYERVRVDSVRVYLDGAKTDNGKIVMQIENSGLLQDRYKGKVFNFLGAPWIRNYEYCSEDLTKNDDVELDDVPSVCMSRHYKTLVSTSTLNSFDGFYPKPTLFSTWVVSVPREQNPGLDLSGLRSIQINFSGSLLVGHTNYSSYDMYGNPPKVENDK